ncbi:MAG: hypothetical protein QOF12_1828 [Solirubrobacteraceae bacterium]|nr:hypothetical protein [Solirubrobacteraceae bacterium]
MKVRPESDDVRLERGRGAAAPRRALLGRPVRLSAEGLRPETDEGLVDLTIYAPDPHGWPLSGAPAGSPRYAVVVEATLRVRAGRTSYTFRTVPKDVPGRYVALFRRLDCSSRPVARATFDLR